MHQHRQRVEITRFGIYLSHDYMEYQNKFGPELRCAKKKENQEDSPNFGRETDYLNKSYLPILLAILHY